MALDLNDYSLNTNTLTNSGADDETSILPFSASTHAASLVAASNDYLNCADSASLSITGDMTIECWVRLTSQPAQDTGMTFVAKWNSGASKRSYNLHYYVDAVDNYVRFQVDSAGDSASSVSWTTTLSNNTWYHLAVTYDASAGSAILYIDSAAQSTESGLDTSIHDNDSSLDIGAIAEHTTWFLDGRIDEIRIWNDIRTSGEIATNYNKRLSSVDSSLAAYYPFESWSASGGKPMFFSGGVAIG